MSLYELSDLELEEEIKAISQFSTILHSKSSVDDIFWTLVKNIICKLNLNDCVIYLYDEQKGALVQVAACGQKNPEDREIINRLEIPFGEGIVGHAAKTKKPIIVNDTLNDDRYIIDDRFRRSELAVPILNGDKLIGVIDSEHSQPYFYTEKHLHIFTIIANLCGYKIKDLKRASGNFLCDDNIYYQQLLNLYEEEKIYLDPSLSLAGLAEGLGISAGYLSRLINKISGKSFNQFTNEYRVKECKRKLSQKEYSHYNILSVGLESGFNSKASFNRNFKEITGESPQSYQLKLGHSKN
jgi:AraC-like DNA-binding protein